MKKVYVVLHSLLGNNSAWQHVKKHQQAQDGKKTWRVIHAHFFGGDKATALCQQTLHKLTTLKFDGMANPRMWSFEKNTTAHIAQHNILPSLHIEYGIDPLSEMMKIKYFEGGITNLLFTAVQLSI